MCIRFYLVVIFNLVSQLSNAQSFLGTPISGKEGINYTIVNYVDWSANGFQDAYCGTKSYDGHEGTDYVLRSFNQMDSGVNVLAADSGIITFIQDGIFDRETTSDTSKGLGNYVAIEHFNSYYTYYGHLKKNSIGVKVGDTVKTGQVIGEVGSSGNSSDPHLHFELWFDSLFVVDPFSGSCGNSSSLWLNPLLYDTSFSIWDHGLYLKNIDLNTLQEREPSTICCPYELVQGQDTLSFWTHLQGLRKDDTLTVDWLDSSNTVQFTFGHVLNQDQWYYYFWTYILTDSMEVGNWQVVLYRNQKEVLREQFKVKGPIATKIAEQKSREKACLPYASIVSKHWENLVQKQAIHIYQMDGTKVDAHRFFSRKSAPKLVSSILIVQSLQGEKVCTYKVGRIE